MKKFMRMHVGTVLVLMLAVFFVLSGCPMPNDAIDDTLDVTDDNNDDNDNGGDDPQLPNEGSIDSPVTLSLDTPHSGRVGATDTAYEDSFYTFTTSDAGDYTIAVTGVVPADSDIDFALYSSADFTGSVASDYGIASDGIADIALDGSTAYFLEVMDIVETENITYTITIESPSGGGGVGTDATLSSITLTSPVTSLNEVFAAATTAYTAEVDSSVTSIVVTATPADANATVLISQGVSSGGSPFSADLAEGDNAVTITVTAEDTTTTGVYTVTVTRAPSAQVGSWVQLGSGAIGTVGTSVYEPPSLAFDSDNNPYVAYIDESTADVGVKRSTDGATWSALGGGLHNFYNNYSGGASSVDMTVVGNASSGRVYLSTDISTSLFYFIATNSIDLSDDTWEGPYGTTMPEYDSFYAAWGEDDKNFHHVAFGSSMYLAYDDNSAGFVLLGNDGSTFEFSEELSGANSGIGWTYNFAFYNLDNMAVGDYTWNGSLYDLTVYTGNTTSGFSQVDTATINAIATGDGLMALDLAYNRSNGYLGVVVSDDSGLTRMYEYNGSSWSQIGGDVVTAAEASSYSFVWLAYDSTGKPTVLLGSSGTWTGGKRYNSAGGSWENLAAPPNNATKVSDIAFAGGTLYVCGAYNNGSSYEARVWTFSEQ